MSGLLANREFHHSDRDERLLFLVRDAKSSSRKQKWFSEKDVSLLLLHGILGAAAMAAPVKRWPAVCQLTSSLRAAKYKRREFSSFSRKASDVLGLYDPLAISELYRTTHRRLHERHMTYIRERFSRRDVDTEIGGLDHLRRSLERESGVVLWNTPTQSDVIVTKRALAAVGLLAHQLSVRSHGFSQSRFAERYLNPRQIMIENRYLAGRIWFEGEDAISATRDVMRKLKQKLPVLFTNSLFSGRSFLGVPVGSRYIMPLPTTPISIAAKAGVPLHIVTTIEKAPFTHYFTEISEALVIDHASGRSSGDDGRIATLALRARDIIVSQLQTYPDQLRLWDRFIDRAQLEPEHGSDPATEHNGA